MTLHGFFQIPFAIGAEIEHNVVDILNISGKMHDAFLISAMHHIKEMAQFMKRYFRQPFQYF